MTAAEKKKIQERIKLSQEYAKKRIATKGDSWKNSLEGKKIYRRIERLKNQLTPTPPKQRTQIARKESRTGRATAGNTTTRGADGKRVGTKPPVVADSPNKKKGKEGNQGRVVLDGMKKKVKLEPSMNDKKKKQASRKQFGAMTDYMNANFNRRN